MTFSQELLLTLVDKAAIGVLILALGFWLNRKLERFKGDLEWKRTIAAQRTTAYRQLWALTRAIGGTGSRGALSKDKRSAFSTMLSRWYWDDGNGLLLSLAATQSMMQGWELLNDLGATDQQIRDHYSMVRTHLKTECGVYESDDARKTTASK